MEISFCTAPGNFNRENGYGNASYNIIESLKALGHHVPYDHPKSPVQLNFCQPTWMNIRKDQYSIGYTPWESTLLPEGWADTLKTCDEVWTTSNWCKEVFESNGLKDVQVYNHGIEDVWKNPQKRLRGSVIKYLHVGGPASRKGAQITLDAFLAAFGSRSDVHLTLKCVGHNEARWKDNKGNILGALSELTNVSIDNRMLSTEQLVQLYLDHDVLVYPSMGEGFGLIPLQALATGMPAIVTNSWCDYQPYILPLSSKLGQTQWPTMHPGEIYYPDFDDLVDWFKLSEKHFDNYALDAFNETEDLYREYDWVELTADAFAPIFNAAMSQ